MKVVTELNGILMRLEEIERESRMKHYEEWEKLVNILEKKYKRTYYPYCWVNIKRD